MLAYCGAAGGSYNLAMQFSKEHVTPTVFWEWRPWRLLEPDSSHDTHLVLYNVNNHSMPQLAKLTRGGKLLVTSNSKAREGHWLCDWNAKVLIFRLPSQSDASISESVFRLMDKTCIYRGLFDNSNWFLLDADRHRLREVQQAQSYPCFFF